jgi:hypothetical protein
LFTKIKPLFSNFSLIVAEIKRLTKKGGNTPPIRSALFIVTKV